MFLHLGADTVVQTEHILGIFDLDTTTVQKHSREFLNRAEKEGRVVNVSPFELPKSFVVCDEGGKRVIYLSQLGASTLLGRLMEVLT
ncbi:MAG: DUF370 domain-containing protein [Clostridia bacterium]|nr:DUF370 domain-containing protein [Clostridia bacterium]MBQ8469793.1 DUF370 domain-containing protein [Clostridia bacterium]